MLLVLHAVLVGASLLLTGVSLPITLLGVAGSTWIVLRATRTVIWNWWCAPTTLVLLGLIALELGSHQQLVDTTWSSPILFAPHAIALLLGLIGSADFAESLNRIQRLLHAPVVRRRIYDWALRHGLRFLLWGAIAFVFVYSVAVPIVEEIVYRVRALQSDPNLEMDRLTLVQGVLFRFCEGMSGIWFFVIGCCVGSFLNVVIYRVPMGISVMTKASHCPNCQRDIPSRDNLPLIGWLQLKGRCRGCEAEISARYPLVECATGLLFLLLYFVELISGGTNLPGRNPNSYAGALWILFYTKWDLVGLYVFHCYVFCAVLCWTMMERDGRSIPIRSICITVALALAATVIWPLLLPFFPDYEKLPFSSSVTWTQRTTAIQLMFVGGIAGLLAGVMLRRLAGVPQHPAVWILPGMALGWKAICVVSLLCFVTRLIALFAMVLSQDEVESEKNCEERLSVSGDSSPSLTESIELPMSNSIPRWWLFPAVLLIHHCLWRQLAIPLGTAL